MRLVNEKGKWRIEGEGSERARVAYASLKGDQVVYTVEGEQTGSRSQPSLDILRCGH